jgi:hypothetical protein
MDTLCAACGAVFTAKDDTHCDACGAARASAQGALVTAGAVRAMGSWKDLRRLCGWCGAATPDLEREGCASCGGQLPGVPPRLLAERNLPSPILPQPAGPPRKLPSGYAERVRYWKNVEWVIGVVFMFVGTLTAPLLGFGLIFVGFGYYAYKLGRERADKQLRALESGVPVEGTITKVALDRTKSINKRHPWKLEFTFESGTGPVAGSVESWDPTTEARVAGERIWIVCDPGSADVCSPWPPIR